MSGFFYIFSHDVARARAAQACQESPEGWVCRIGPPNKSRDQEAKYHAMLGDIAEQVTFHGQKFDAETWKRLLIDAFHHDTKDDPELRDEWRRMGDLQFMPAFNHAGLIALGFQSRKFTKPLASAFIEWLYAMGAENNVQWKNHYREAA